MRSPLALAAFAVVLCLPALAAPIRGGADSPFGIVCPWPEVGQIGAPWIRCGAGATQLGNWPVLEPERGRYDWGPADAELATWGGEGLIFAPILGYTPAWASTGAKSEASYPPGDLADFARFAEAISRRYAGRVGTWECWNEPNIEFFAGTIANFADLQKAMAVGVLRGNPEARVLFGGVAGADVPFLERCYEQGAGPYFDIMAMHPYQWGTTFNDGWFTAKVASIRDVLDRRGDRAKPIWLNELGWSTGDAGVTEEIQARLLVQCYVTALGLGHLGAERTFWFCVKDWGGPGYGLYTDDGKKKRAYWSYKHMSIEVLGREFLGRVEAGDARAYLFGPREGQETALLVAWAPGADTVEVPLAIAGGPFPARDLLGEARQVGSTDGLALTATPDPIYIDVPASAATLAQLPAQREFSAPKPDPAARPLIWASVHPPAGTEHVWLVPGEPRDVDLRVFNGTDEPASGEVVLELGGQAFRAQVDVAPMGLGRQTVAVAVPAGTPEGTADLRISGRVGGIELAAYATPVRIAAGPVIEFLANSHLERSLYVQPGANSGLSESRRFGSEWVYKLPVARPGRVDLNITVGAHNGQSWSVSWSQDGTTWSPLLSGQSWPEPRTATIAHVDAGDLYLQCKGQDQQLDRVMAVFAGG